MTQAVPTALQRLAAEMRLPVSACAPAEDGRTAAFAGGFRLLPIRLLHPHWQHQDHPPLLAHGTASGAWHALLPHGDKISTVDAAQDDVFLPYPRWPEGPATARRWLSLAAPRASGVIDWLLRLGTGLPPLVPALAALLLLPGAPWPLVALLACLTLAGVLANWATSLGLVRNARDANLRLHGLLWDRVLAARPSPGWGYAELASRLRDTLAAGQRELEAPDRLSEAASTWALAMLVIAIASPYLALVCGTMLLAGFASLHRLWGRIGALALAAAGRTPDLEEKLTGAAGAVPTFRGLRAIGWHFQRTDAATAEVLASGARIDRRIIATRAAGRVLVLLQAVAIGVAAASGWAGALSLPALAAVLLAAVPAANAVFRFAAVSGTHAARLVRIAAAMPALAEIADHPTPAPAVTTPFATLTLSRVHFAYPGGAPILCGADLTVQRGEIVAIASASGCGRTTLLRLLAGTLQPQTGRVAVNGGDPPSGQVTAVFSDQEIPAASIRSLILGGHPLPVAVAEEAARLVGLDDTIAKLPMGLHTLVVPGVFPDGLIQRLLIARALAAQPEVLLLDEVLSALDPGRRRDLLDELRRRGITVVLTAHDPAILALAGRILRLESGRLTA